LNFDKEKVAKTVVLVEKKKTTTVKPSSVMVKHDVLARSNAGVKKKEIKTVKKAEATSKTCPAKKFIPKATLTDSRSQKASLCRAESLKATISKSAKKVAPLKDQNRMQKSEPEQTSFDKVQTQALQDSVAESEVYIESIKSDFIYSSMELKDPLACDSSLVQIEALDGFETKPEVRLKTMEFDFNLPSMELVDPSVCNESEPFSCNGSREEDSLITYTVNERFEPIPDEELPENSTIMPTVIKSSHASSNKEVSEESLIAPPVSESTQDEGVLEDESESRFSANFLKPPPMRTPEERHVGNGLDHLVKNIKEGKDKQKSEGKKDTPKVKADTIYMVQSWQRKTRQKVSQKFSRESEISFPTLTADNTVVEPLTIEINAWGHDIHRMYNDGGHPRTYYTNIVNVATNDEERRIDLDLLEERRERATICEAKANSKMKGYYDAKVRGVSFRP
nr:reverse transcriptase domain-containing protein [Tanacetum cinerariifolium]